MEEERGRGRGEEGRGKKEQINVKGRRRARLSPSQLKLGHIVYEDFTPLSDPPEGRTS
jgi:hypothetical protein